MELNEDDMMVKNIFLFTALLENKGILEKITEIEDILKTGADINAADASHNDDTPLHVAIKKKEIDIVKLLLEWDADVTRLNGDDKSALYVARGLTGVDGKEIKDLIEEHARKKQVATSAEPGRSNNKKPRTILQRSETTELCKYLKRYGTTGVGGQLYKTKLLSLVLLRASNDPDILVEKFYLRTNIPETGVFYDVCFKFNVGNLKKSIRLFMQCKHLPTEACMTDADLRSADGDWSLPNCYDSFLKIKDKFGSDINDPIFGEDYNNVESNFVLYTSSKDNLKGKFYGNTGLSAKVNYLINTGKNTMMFRFNYTEKDISLITNEVQKRRIISLAQHFIDFVFSEKGRNKNMLDDKLIRTYHVVLVHRVLQITRLIEEGYREVSFRPEFFEEKDVFLVLFRETLCKLTVKNYYNESQFGSEELVNLFKQLSNVPSSDEISMFINFVVQYDEKNNKLKLMNDLLVKGFSSSDIQELTESLQQIHVTATTIKEAILKAGENKLSSIQFKVPPSFGNIDMTINEKELDRVLDNIASVFAYLFNYYRVTKIIELNETNVCQYIKSNGQIVTTEFLQNDDGIGSAIGNLLVPDNDSKMLKFNTTTVLPKKANILLQKLKTVLPRMQRLEDYRLKIDFDGCPRISFNSNDYDGTLAKHFLSRLWFYTHQEKEDEIDKTVKIEIDKYYNAHKGPAAFGLRTHIDSIYSTFHDEIQKWWMVTPENTYAPYLTQESEIFRIAQEGVIDNPLVTLHHQMYLSKIKKTGIEFTSAAVKRLLLDDITDRLVNIQTDCDILTGIKIQQHYKNKTNYSFLNFNYMLSLPADDKIAILNELRQTTLDILIVICGISKSRKPVNEDLNRVINIFKGKKVILVTVNDITMKLRIPNHYFIKDEMNDLIHFDEDSRRNFGKDAKLIFQGEEVRLEAILDETSIEFINARNLLNLLDNERIEIGHKLTNPKYEKIQDYYVARWLEKEGSEDTYPVNSLDDIEDNVVLIITKHGMGKSTLLTHVALETKRAAPTRWIVRIDLEDFSNDFYMWQRYRIEINKAEALKFLCYASLKHVRQKTAFQLTEKDGKIVLDTCDASDAKVLLELQLFLHYYNERKITFLFHGFDNVCPPFGAEAIRILKIIEADGVSMWVSSNLVRLPKTILENEFGTSYNLQPIDATRQIGFFHKFWKTNMQMEKVNNEVFSNISELIEYMSGKHFGREPKKKDRIGIPWISMPLHMLYVMAVDFFQTELSNFSFEDINSKLNLHLDIDLNKISTTLGSYMDHVPEAKQAAELAGTPLHMYVAANYFICKIKGGIQLKSNEPVLAKKWDIWRDTVGLYKQFLQHNLNKMCCQSDASNFDENLVDDERKNFFYKHKKLALLAICKEDDLCKLLPADEIKDLKDTIVRIQQGEEKSAFVDFVLDEAPNFFHLMYAEYCAIECVIDLLKGMQCGSMDHMRYKFIWDFIVNILLRTCSDSVRTAFDYKLENDPKLAELTSSDQCRSVIFELLLKQNISEPSATGSDGWSPLHVAVDSGMNNLVKLFLVSLDVNLTTEHMNSAVNVLRTIDVGLTLYRIADGDVALPTNVTDFFVNMKLDKFVDVLKSDRTIELPLQVLSKFTNVNVVNKARQVATRVRRNLIDRAAERFGLSQDNIDLIRHLAERIRQQSNNN